MGNNELSGKPDKMLGVGIICEGLASHPGEVAILLVTDIIPQNLRYSSVGSVGPSADLTIPTVACIYSLYMGGEGGSPKGERRDST